MDRFMPGRTSIAGIGSAVYVYSAGAGTSARPVCDHRGSVHALLDPATGAVLATRMYDAFGRAASATGEWPADVRYGYQSNWLRLCDLPDGSPLYLSPTRAYHAGLGRFLQRDAIDTGLENRYVYALADPVQLVDPEGLWWLADALWETIEDINALVNPVGALVAARGNPQRHVKAARTLGRAGLGFGKAAGNVALSGSRAAVRWQMGQAQLDLLKSLRGMGKGVAGAVADPKRFYCRLRNCAKELPADVRKGVSDYLDRLWDPEKGPEEIGRLLFYAEATLGSMAVARHMAQKQIAREGMLNWRYASAEELEGALGTTEPTGHILIRRGMSATMEAQTYVHEWTHRQITTYAEAVGGATGRNVSLGLYNKLGLWSVAEEFAAEVMATGRPIHSAGYAFWNYGGGRAALEAGAIATLHHCMQKED